MAYELKAKGWNGIEECDGDYSYPTTLFSEKTKTISFGNTSVDITIQAGCTSGYYEAANFDWFVNIKTYRKAKYYYETCNYDYDDLTADDVISDNWYENEGLSKIHAVRIIRKIQAIIDELKICQSLHSQCIATMKCIAPIFAQTARPATARRANVSGKK